ncbi:hypothetical protein [Pedobacter sp. P26]|uniref:hypothetical protein n=1 Tax=Pedobacter sp. P26 TaxID=3423956 RepID=UPI003D672522
MNNICREKLLKLVQELGTLIKSEEGTMQFAFVITGDLSKLLDQDQLDGNNSDIKKILELVTNIDNIINPEPSVYQSKKELIMARAKADIKKDTITNKKK